MPRNKKKNKSRVHEEDNNVRNTPKDTRSSEVDLSATISDLKTTIREISDRVSYLAKLSTPQYPPSESLSLPSMPHSTTGHFPYQVPYGPPIQPVPVVDIPLADYQNSSHAHIPNHQPMQSTSGPLPAPPPTTTSSSRYSSLPTITTPAAHPTSSSFANWSTYVTASHPNFFSVPTYVAPTTRFDTSTQPLTSTMLQNRPLAHSNEYAAKFYPLPSFDGRPEEWPLFLTSFVDTTTEFGYNNKQNLMRLHKALQGDAKRAVCSLLIYPDDVPKAIEELTFNFGRPDVLIRSQMEKVKSIAAITDEKIEMVLPFANQIRNMVALFKSANCQHHLLNTTLLDQLVAKLPLSKRYEWAKFAATVQPFPSVESFAEWIHDLARIVSLMSRTESHESILPTIRQPLHKPAARRVLHSTEAIVAEPSKLCTVCKKSHCIWECDQFKSFPVDDRWSHVKKAHLCFGCLRKGHSLTLCRKKQTCSVDNCSRVHHPLLHQAPVPMTKPEHVLNCQHNKSGQLFKIVPVLLNGPSGSVSTYAMLDEGSSISLIDANVATTLGLKGRATKLTLQWYGDEKKTESSSKVALNISGTFINAPSFALKNVWTVRNLNLPTQTLNRADFPHTNALPVDNYCNAKPMMLLGLDNSFLGVYNNVIEGDASQPIAVETKLGWIVFGPVENMSDSAATVLHINDCTPSKKLTQLVDEYLSVEYFGVRNSNILLESEDNRRAREILGNTTRYKDGRYEIGLLWRKDEFQFPSSYEMAKRRLLKVEAKMKENVKFAEKYKEEMSKYIQKGYARLLSPEESDITEPKTWHLPHFGVVNPNKPEKLRIVFDAAATVSNISLNSALLKGPEHAQSLFSILFKFRQGIVAVAGDIREMFSQVRIHPTDQNSQRFLWREGNPDEPIKTYAMVSMIFGAACSPCCAEYVKNLNANEYGGKMPKGRKVVIENTYVDDLVASFDNEAEAEEVILQAVKINEHAGFTLRNFVSNCKNLEKHLNGQESEHHAVNLESQKTFDKILGLFWNTKADTLEFHFGFHKVPEGVMQCERPPTKREMLGIIMAIFDPFGLLANFTIASKILLQAVWKFQVDWDEELPYQLYVPWNKWWKDMKRIERFSIQRCYSPLLQSADELQLHVFVDASTNAYAAVVYLRVKSKSKVDVTLVAAKSRCAPIKTMTIPRLELQAAVLGCRLKEMILQGLEFTVHKVIFWSDSKTVVLWIRSTAREYKQFVACRIAEILSSSSPPQWNWLPGTMNVADDATKVKDIEDNSRWVNGPEFLYQSEDYWPKEPIDMISKHCHDEEVPPRIFLLSNDKNHFINFLKFSSFCRLLRVTAWIQRFIKNCQLNAIRRQNEEITASELSEAELVICRLVQQEVYSTEIESLALKGRVSKSSDLYQLTPHLGSDGVIRVRGRLDAAYCLPPSARQPIIMPRMHHVTRLLLEGHHRNRHHQNDRLVINEIRQRFWVPNALALMKSVRKNCPVCIIGSAKPKVPLMGQLPADRLTPYVRPFSYSGVDYCGPFSVAIGRRREKRWICLFTCMTTRAIHLEVASDLSTDAFLLCMRNFMNRRGTPVRMRSDNGTNFVRAQKELTSDNRLFDIFEIQRYMCQAGIDWVFNCPLYPNAGGCWERLIQCVKRLLSRVFKEEAPRLETFRSALIEAENIINSRPLTELPLSPEDDEPLTPNHFLVGCLNSTQTPNTSDEPVCLRKQWRIAQNLKDRLWKRWTVEYLPQLLRRSKWRQEVPALTPGQLVIICDSTQPRSQWKKGLVTEVFKAKDGQVRSAEVRTSNGTLRRPASKLAALFHNESSNRSGFTGGGMSTPLPADLATPSPSE